MMRLIKVSHDHHLHFLPCMAAIVIYETFPLCSTVSFANPSKKTMAAPEKQHFTGQRDSGEVEGLSDYQHPPGRHLESADKTRSRVSVHRFIGGIPIPETAAVEFKRRATTRAAVQGFCSQCQLIQSVNKHSCEVRRIFLIGKGSIKIKIKQSSEKSQKTNRFIRRHSRCFRSYPPVVLSNNAVWQSSQLSYGIHASLLRFLCIGLN